jgi:hypothetical protein
MSDDLNPAGKAAPDSPGLSATLALCNQCGRLTEAQIGFEGERVVLSKWCPDHGLTRALISSDREWYQRSLSYVKPGTNPVNRAVSEYRGCPDSCGLCPQHQQHTCVPILEITDRCNLDCPICLVSGRTNRELSLEQVERIMERLIHYEAKLNMINLSGGEPTLHPDFLKVVDACLRPEVGVLSVSTNGLRLSEDKDLLKELRDRGVVISLQFDGFRGETYRALRGKPELASIKRRLIDQALTLGAKISLTVTLGRGINEEEFPEILRLFFSSDSILSMMIQPLVHTSWPGDPMNRITIPDVVRLVALSSGGLLRESDFSPLPCSHPTCFALTYLLKLKNGGLISLPSIIDTESYLDIIKNQALFGTDWDTLEKIKDALYRLWSSDGILPDREKILKAVKQILLDINRLGPKASHRELLDLGARNVKSIFVHHFMDRATFDLSRAVKCCNHYPRPDGRLIPACVRNNRVNQA